MANKRDENVDANSDSTTVKTISRYITVERIGELCERFPIAFPKKLTTIKCSSLEKIFGREIVESNINSAYPIIHESVLKLYEKFLQLNRDVAFYRNMNVMKFVDRLLKKRAVSFLVGSGFSLFFTDARSGQEKSADVLPNVTRTMMSKDGKNQIYFCKGGWHTIGTEEEQEPLTRENCLTYDEIELSSFLSVSSFTIFVNSGSRCNMGVYEQNREVVQDKGIIIGLIGPQFEKSGVMEHKRMTSNGPEISAIDGMGKLMKDFYAYPRPKFLILPDITTFHVSAYQKRLALSFDTLLNEANTRARHVDETAFIHVVGIGLGVWRHCDEQVEIFVETFYERLYALGDSLKNVSDVRFAYIGVKECMKMKKVGNISIHFKNVDPHIRIEKGKLLVVSYAWDGNALPGNEFWTGNLCGSSDPAAACSTQIAELHNAHINENVCGQNLHIATLDRGVITYLEYLESHRNVD